MRLLRLAVAALLGGFVAVASVAAPADAGASRPPAPSGAIVLQPGQVPVVCTTPGLDAYAPTYGVYWSNRSRTWVSAPYCYPRWGYLETSGSGVVPPRGRFTVTAIPADGSNSAEYAPQTNSITWAYPGRRVSGCGSADLSCTVVLTDRATREWQWGMFHVTMPRTFFINSPGEFCAGQPICAGNATNAWAFVGTPPRGTQIPVSVSGTLTKGCGQGACPANPALRGAKIVATGEDGTKRTESGADGGFELQLTPGRWTLRPSVEGVRFSPAIRRVTVDEDGVAGQDFRGCLAGIGGGGVPAFRARPTQGGTTTFVGVDRTTCRGSTRTATVVVNYSVPRSRVGTMRWEGMAWCDNGTDFGARFSVISRPGSIQSGSESGVLGIRWAIDYLDNGRDYTGQLSGYLTPFGNPTRGTVVLGNLSFDSASGGGRCERAVENLALRPAM